MGTSLSRSALITSIAAAFLAACGGSRSPISTAGTPALEILAVPSRAGEHQVPRLSYQVLHRFTPHGNPERGGAYPWAGLVDVGGTLYGTTSEGGTHNGGTVFTISTTGKRKTLYNFDRSSSSSDGFEPFGDLINVNGTLYGTTWIGGACGSGTVYGVSTTGTEAVLHSFCDSDGSNPLAGLTNVKGTLYGTTFEGVSGGTAYSISTGGTFKVLHTFCGKGDGCGPVAAMLNVGGTLYGTTSYGGNGGAGTVFSLSSAGTEEVLYGFQGEPDGQSPGSSLIDVNGVLYGTTMLGGNYGCYPYASCGTIYNVTTKGKEQVLYRFRGYSDDGVNPMTSLLEVGGVLYGTTQYGGNGAVGTVFSFSNRFSKRGKERVLHSFLGGSDGAVPTSEMIYVNGTLYGTTYDGGRNARCHRRAPGCGTVFALTP